MNSKIPYKSPVFVEESFNCPFCNAFANQRWEPIFYQAGIGYSSLQNTKICFCAHCGKYSIWHNQKMIYPGFTNIEPANDDLSNDVKSDYIEAAAILQKSPRGAAALLRLAIQKLCKQLGEKGENLNNDIGNLVKRGLPQKVQQSLDVLRVIGNNAVHPGSLDLKDDVKTATSLFKLTNFIADKMITEPKEIDEIYETIPNSAKEQIKKRDS